jgi:hypothetical protein
VAVKLGFLNGHLNGACVFSNWAVTEEIGASPHLELASWPRLPTPLQHSLTFFAPHAHPPRPTAMVFVSYGFVLVRVRVRWPRRLTSMQVCQCALSRRKSSAETRVHVHRLFTRSRRSRGVSPSIHVEGQAHYSTPFRNWSLYQSLWYTE